MSTKVLTFGLFLALQTSALAEALHLDFPAEGARVIFTSSESPKGLPETGEVIREKSFELDLSKAKPTDYVVVWDRDSNNVAISKIAPLKGTWHLQAKDFSLIGNVSVKIESKGSPVSSAEVQLKDGKATQSQLVDPTSKGEAKFFAVAPGSVQVTTRFKLGGTEADPLVQVFQVALSRKAIEPQFVVALPEGVATNQAETKPVEAINPKTAPETPKDEAKTEPTKDATKDSKPSPVASGFIMLIALALIGGAVYALYMKAKGTPDLGDHLRKMGIPVAPEPPVPGDPTTGVADAGFIAPAPVAPSKIMLPDSEPALLTATPVAAPTASGQLRLRVESGGSYVLASGESIAGRDESVPLSFPGESSISRQHAIFSYSNGSMKVRDSGSTNGTFVNGQRISAETTLKLGDVVQLGAVRLYVEG